jgi:hypothetical protein
MKKRTTFSLAPLLLSACLALLPVRDGAAEDRVRPPAGLDQAMQRFERAVVRKDIASLKGLFSRHRPLQYAAYDIETGLPLTYRTVGAELLRSDLQEGGEWRRFFCAEPNGYEYRVHFVGGGPWVYRGGGMFFAPKSPWGNTYLRWRLEQGRWVVREIGETLP